MSDTHCTHGVFIEQRCPRSEIESLRAQLELAKVTLKKIADGSCPYDDDGACLHDEHYCEKSEARRGLAKLGSTGLKKGEVVT